MHSQQMIMMTEMLRFTILKEFALRNGVKKYPMIPIELYLYEWRTLIVVASSPAHRRKT